MLIFTGSKRGDKIAQTCFTLQMQRNCHSQFFNQHPGISGIVSISVGNLSTFERKKDGFHDPELDTDPHQN
jgi:hypothetical protein